GRPLSNFMAYESSFRGGVLVSVGDIDGDGRAEIVAGTGVGGGPVVSVFKADGTPAGRFLAGDGGYRAGAAAAVGDTNGDGQAEIVAGAGPGTVSVYSTTGNVLLASFSLFEQGAAVTTAA